MSKKNIFLGFIGATVLSTAVLTLPDLAAADHYGRYDRRDNDRRSSWGEVRRERAELRRDLAELGRDRADLRRMYRDGASRAAIDRKRDEIRHDMREVRESRQEIRDDYRDIRRDRYDDRRSYSPWWGWGNGWWSRR